MRKNKITKKQSTLARLLQVARSTPAIEKKDPPPYPLQIKAIPVRERIIPDRYCKLVHLESGLSIPGQFTYPEASEILKITRYWDFSLDQNRIPRCVERLRSLLENVCARDSKGGETNG